MDFVPAEVVSYEDTNIDTDGNVTRIQRIVASTVPGVCDRLAYGAYSAAAGEKLLWVRFPLPPGAQTAAVSQDGAIVAGFNDVATFCGPTAPLPKGVGSVTITNLNGTIDGVLALSFDNGGHVGGSFSAKACRTAFDTRERFECPTP
jgi:hypothetical protein